MHVNTPHCPSQEEIAYHNSQLALRMFTSRAGCIWVGKSRFCERRSPVVRRPVDTHREGSQGILEKGTHCNLLLRGLDPSCRNVFGENALDGKWKGKTCDRDV